MSANKTSSYLDTDAILNAADLVNSTLQSKGYISSKLHFNSIDWPELINPQLEHDADARLDNLEVTDKIYDNDKNIINIIYSLYQSIERHQAQSRTFNKLISTKDATIENLQKKVESLEHRLAASETKLNKYVQVDQSQHVSKIQHLSHINKLQAQDLNKMKTWSTDIKTKYLVELKKKDYEISQLKDKLLEDRNLSTTISYGRPLSINASESLGEINNNREVNGNLIHNNNPIIDNSGDQIQSSTVEPILVAQFEEVAVQLGELMEKFSGENAKFSQFMKVLDTYFTRVNLQLSNRNPKNLASINLPNPSDEIHLQDIIDHASDEIESFELIVKPLLSNVYKNFHYVSNVIAMVDSDIQTSENAASTSSESATIEKLRHKNEELYQNWQNAIKTLEEWKSYKQSQKER